MGSQKQTARYWPGKFPVGRVLLAAFAVPFLVAYFVLVLGDIVAANSSQDRLSPEIILWFGTLTAGLFAWPGYIVFLLLGVPTLYALFRGQYCNSYLFMAFGALYTPLPWFVSGLRGHVSGATYSSVIKAEVPLFMLLGVGAGLVTRFIVLRAGSVKISRDHIS